MNNNSKVANTVLAIIGILVVAYFIFTTQKQDEKIKELENEREDLKKLLKAINENKKFDAVLKRELETLAKKYKKIDAAIAGEITEAIQLFQIGQAENGIKSMVKIMEHLLDRRLASDVGFLTWLRETNRKKSLHEMLEYSESVRLIAKDERGFFMAIKQVRNKEAHEIAYSAPPLLKAAGFLCALHAIFRLSEMVYPEKFKKLK
jgi:septal ring factor EnvC (AmiA/AmiB activator)